MGTELYINCVVLFVFNVDPFQRRSAVKIITWEKSSDYEDDSLDVASAVLINNTVSEEKVDSRVISKHGLEGASKASTVEK